MNKKVVLTLALILLFNQTLAFEFCEDGEQGENNLRLISIDDMLKENSKEWTWSSSQEVELEARVENREDEENDYILEIIFKDGDNTIKIAEDDDDLKEEFSLSANERETISIKFETDEDLEKGDYDLYIKFYKEDEEDEECTENSEEEITIEKIELCEDGNVDDDDLEITKISDGKEDNENAWEWFPGDDIKISVKAENKDYSERDFIIELVFLDENNEEISLAEDSSDLEKEITIEEDEDEKVNFNFKLKSEIEEESYTLYAKIYDEENEEICTSLKAESTSDPITINIERTERKVIVTEVEGPTSTTTSSEEKFLTTIANLGSKDETKVLVIAYNRLLGIEERIELEDLDSGDEETVEFNLAIPENISATRYSILFSTEFEYKESQDYYRSASDEDDDIKHYITISQTEKKVEINENETQTETQANKTEIIIENENETNDEKPTTIITGNATGSSNNTPKWIIPVILAVLAAGLILFFLKKTKPKQSKTPESPKVIRRYTAKID